MLAAGHETTATGLAFALELLLRKARQVERLREAWRPATTPTPPRSGRRRCGCAR